MVHPDANTHPSISQTPRCRWPPLVNRDGDGVPPSPIFSISNVPSSAPRFFASCSSDEAQIASLAGVVFAAASDVSVLSFQLDFLRSCWCVDHTASSFPRGFQGPGLPLHKPTAGQLERGARVDRSKKSSTQLHEAAQECQLIMDFRLPPMTYQHSFWELHVLHVFWEPIFLSRTWSNNPRSVERR